MEHETSCESPATQKFEAEDALASLAEEQPQEPASSLLGAFGEVAAKITRHAIEMHEQRVKNVESIEGQLDQMVEEETRKLDENERKLAFILGELQSYQAQLNAAFSALTGALQPATGENAVDVGHATPVDVPVGA